ncbi:MAG TPA: LemA family protein, partial [Acidobacteriota bacterium]|nr:LemA family protein [Acidobacteriota bacterium]
VTALRAQAVQAQQSFNSAASTQQQIAATQQAESALSRLLVIVENYPDLKATSNFADLQVQLEGTENRISVARDKYNQQVKAYNTKVRSFPSNIIAGFAGLTVAMPFEANAGAQNAPVVDFN